MKRIFYILSLFISQNVFSQAITSSIQANFGVDADLQANFYNSKLTLTGDDDWFTRVTNSGIGV
ncbi:MAG: hypothetical protein ACTHJN_09530, partial [Ginsengibacter sp.]